MKDDEVTHDETAQDVQDGTAQDETPAGSLENYGEGDDGQDYVDRSKIDFDPADGLLSGTAIDGTSDIPDPDSAGGDGGDDDGNGDNDGDDDGDPARNGSDESD